MSKVFNKLKFTALFFRAKEVGEKRVKFQFNVGIVHEAAILISSSL